MKIKYFQYGKGLKKICFVAGIHGIENTGIQTALELYSRMIHKPYVFLMQVMYQDYFIDGGYSMG